jgi:hypothetical protein
MAAKAKPRGGVLPSPVLLMRQALNIWLYQHVLPPPLEATPHCKSAQIKVGVCIMLS